VADRTSLALNTAVNRFDRIQILAVILALGLTAFLAIQPSQNWLLLLVSGLAALGTDAIVRTHPRAHFQRLDDTAIFLFVPVLFTLGLGIFVQDVAYGHWTIAIGLLSAIPYWAILRAEYESIDRSSPNFQSTRLVLNVATYVTAFLFFAAIYNFGLNPVTASFAAGVVGVLLAVDILREEGLDTARTMIYASAVGVILAESAWTTHFLPLEGRAAAVFLLLSFYLMTGLMHNYLGHRLNLKTAAEFTAVALAGAGIIALSHLS